MDEKELQAELRRVLRDVGLVSNALQVLADDVGYLAEKLGMVPMQAAPRAPIPGIPEPPIEQPQKIKK
jgi:hypothetical protein